MVNYVYQPQSIGDVLAIYIDPFVPTSHQESIDHITLIYGGNRIVGINIFEPKKVLPDLQPGIQRTLNQSSILAINEYLKRNAINFILPPFESGFVIGSIATYEPHPDSESLFICQVDLSKTVIQIVTNSKKVRIDDRVVVAQVGAMLLDGQILQETTLMNVRSQGMFCSQKTLGITPEDQVGVLVLPKDQIIGKDFYGT